MQAHSFAQISHKGKHLQIDIAKIFTERKWMLINQH